VDGLSNWYVRRSRRRFWKSENDADKLSAYNTIYTCLVTLAKMMAPFTPFLADELYRNLVRMAFPEAPESVHLARFPEADMSKVDTRLTEDIHLAMKICSLGRSARSMAGITGIKVRQPLLKVLVAKVDAKELSNWEKEALRRLETQILEELNVKELEFSRRSIFRTVEIESDIDLKDPKNESLLKRKLEDYYLSDFDQDEIVFKIEGVSGKPIPPGVALPHLSMSDKPGFAVSQEGGYAVAVTTKITPELADEGLAREIVHRLQTMRKNAGFDIADYITTYYERGKAIDRALKQWAGYIQQ
jgi:isoleucyl-tRNA synthetase